MIPESHCVPSASRIFELPTTSPSRVPAPTALRHDELRDERSQDGETDWEVLKDVATD